MPDKSSKMSRKTMIRDVCDEIDDIITHLYNYAFLVIARGFRKPAMFVIGDSHTGLFKRKFPFIAHHVGPATAYGTNKEQSTTDSKRKIEKIVNKVKINDHVLFVIGEIDCRIHIYNQFKKNREEISLPEIINRVLKNYLEVLQDTTYRCSKVSVCGVPPAGRQKNVFGYPYYGDEKIRIEIHRLFNFRPGWEAGSLLITISRNLPSIIQSI
jgi:hypothetical protein